MPTNRIDCLFLDLHVPAAAIKDPSLKLPVISWFYGGAYIFGAKDQFSDAIPFYGGTGLVQESRGNVIFVSSNYRVSTRTNASCVCMLKIYSLARTAFSLAVQWSVRVYPTQVFTTSALCCNGSKTTYISSAATRPKYRPGENPPAAGASCTI